LASFIGERYYEQIASESLAMVAERFFARAAFDLPPLGHGDSAMFDLQRIYGETIGELYRGLIPDGEAATLGRVHRLGIATIRRLEAVAPAWLDLLAAKVLQRGYRVVGATTTFEQTCASIALLNRLKALDPAVVTILGGANCEGEMAEGILSTGARVDYVFSGESEKTFPDFLETLSRGGKAENRIILGKPCMDMDAVPFMSSREYFDQRKLYLPRSAPGSVTHLSYETSRGCWWGQKQHCTFCGLNGEGMTYRKKSTGRVIAELGRLIEESPTRKVVMTDNIMPREYLRTLLPQLPDALPGLEVFYEQKSNLTWADVQILRQAGINAIQPGIEALSTGLLRLMKKGVQARQNVMLLRYGRITGLELVWNMICGFPNDDLSFYEETLELVRLIPHLPPPSGLWYLSIDRFSPYHVNPQSYGIANVQPVRLYHDIFPETAAISKIAYHFTGEYTCGTKSHIERIRELSSLVRSWERGAKSEGLKRPELKICRRGGDYFLVDTRGLDGTESLRRIDESEARLLLTARSQRRTPEEQKAIGRKLAVVLDNWFVPLPVARPDLFAELSEEAAENRRDPVGSANDLTRLEIVNIGVPAHPGASHGAVQ
jgi:ribosomal peptide maturation radical SAM protein 1